MIFEEMGAFMQMTEQEQRLRLGNESLLSLEEFWSYRLGASAVFVCLTFNESVAPFPNACGGRSTKNYLDMPLEASIYQ